MDNKLILTDCDNCILAWEWMFDIWMKRHGYTKQNYNAYSTGEAYSISDVLGEQLCTMFNETVYIRNLPPYADAVYYTRKLHEEYGYVFHAITSIGDNPYVVESRIENLHRVFGRSMFFDITCLDPNISKLRILNQYAGSNCLWVEDHLENCALGTSLGLRPVLMNQVYNQVTDTSDKRYKYLYRVNNWKQIYEHITG
jgi:hypothetical protein